MNLYQSYSDSELTTLLHQGSEASFTEIYNRYWQKLYWLAHKNLRNYAAAEEVVQDVFLAIWEKRATISIQSLPVYLAAMTRYAVYRNISKQRKHEETDINTLKVEPHTEKEAEAAEHRLLLEIIENLTNELPEKCRLVFIHNKLLDQPLKQVAEELGISEKTAEAHLTKALKTMRRRLGDAMSVLLFV